MKKALIALVGIAMLAAVPAAATSSAPSESQRAKHMKRFKLHTQTNRAFGPRNYVGTHVLKHDGKFVGYGSYSGYSNPKTKSVFRFALALKGGMIFGRVVQRGPPGPLGGPSLAAPENSPASRARQRSGSPALRP